MKRYALSIIVCALTASAAPAQVRSPLEGVWKTVEEVAPSTDPADKGGTITYSNPQPGLLIFTGRHYSMVIVTSPQPRAGVAPAKDPQNLTDAEKLARYEMWRPFVATSGTYEIKDSTLFIRSIVAKSTDAMARQAPVTWELEFEGTNLVWLIPLGQSPAQPRVKLMRVE